MMLQGIPMQKALPESKAAGTILFSVVIPAFNEAAHIGKTLGSLSSQTLQKQRFEVIVVDNGSTDATLAEAQQFASRLPLRIVSKKNCTIAAVRNYGASLAKGDVLAFLDADCIPPMDWLERSLRLNATNDLWGAHYLVPADCSWVGKTWFAYQAIAQQGEVSFIPASNLFLRRTDFERLGGFTEILQTSEDVDLSLRAKQSGLQVAAHPELAVFHLGTPRTLKRFYRQNRWHGTSVLRVFFANLPTTENLRLVAMSFYALVVFWAAIVVPVFMLPKHHFIVAAVPTLLFLLPALLLSLRKTIAAGRLSDTPGLAVLYLTYFLARAASLTHLSKRNHR